MRLFKVLSFVGAAVLASSAFNASAAPVSCSWSTDNAGGSNGYYGINQSCKDSTGFLVAQRLLTGAPNTPEVCTMKFMAPGISNSGTCKSPSFYNSTPVASSSSSSSSSSVAPVVTTPWQPPAGSTIYETGTCYSYGCQTPSQRCSSNYSATFYVDTSAGGYNWPYFCYKAPASSAPASSVPSTKVVNGVTIPSTATVWMQGTCYSYGCQTPSQTCSNTYRGAFAMAPYPSQNYVCYTN